jgi:ribonucleoside-diphosphate reductase alpha chain
MLAWSKNRPDILTGITKKYLTACGKLYITVNYHNNIILEVFTTNPQNAYCCSELDVLCRTISNSLQSCSDIENLIEVLKDTSCKKCTGFSKNRYYSCPSAIGHCIEQTLINLL